MEFLISFLLFSLFSFWETPLALSSTSFSMVIGTLVLYSCCSSKMLLFISKCAYSQAISVLLLLEYFKISEKPFD